MFPSKDSILSILFTPSSEPIALREVLSSDLDVFFQQQIDPAAVRRAAFAPKDPSDRAAFDSLWQKTLADPDLIVRTVLYGGQVAGFVVCHSWYGQPEVGGWLGREFWGQGVATHALRAFLELVPTRPLYAHVASDNLASLRVLEKCGFRVTGAGTAYSHARGEDFEELILELSEVR